MMNQCRLWLGGLLIEAQPDLISMFVLGQIDWKHLPSGTCQGALP